jgi:hypothetical protein
MAAKKTASKRSTSKGKGKVEKVMREFKHHELRSGRSGKKVSNPKQAIAIGLSEARKAGAKIPKKGAAKKSSGGRTRKTASGAKKSTRKR